MKGQLEPRILVEYVIGRWPVLVGFGILGALIAYAATNSLPPIYQATAVLSFGLNLDREPPLKQSERDLAEGKVVGYISSDNVLDQVLQTVGQQFGFDTVPSLDILRDSIEIVRKQSRWELRVLNEDPKVAASIADVWAQTSEEAFWKAYAHALTAKNLQTRIDELSMRIAKLQAESTSPGDALAESQGLEKIIEELENQLQDEMDLAQGVVSFMTLDKVNNPAVPSKPAARDSRILVVAGSLIGVLSGLMYLLGMVRYRGNLEA